MVRQVVEFGPDGVGRYVKFGRELSQIGLEPWIQKELHEDVDSRTGRDHAA